MAIPLPPLRFAWRRQIAWCGLLALIAFSTLAASSVAAPSEPLVDVTKTVRQANDAVPAAGHAVRSNIETTVGAVRETVDRASAPIADAPRRVDDTVRTAVSPAAGFPARPTPSREQQSHRGAGSIGAPTGAAQRLGDAVGAAGTRPPVGSPSPALTGADTAASAAPAAEASSTSSNGGQDDDPHPGGPGATTGGVSGPLGFVLIAAVLAFVFGFAPRIISTPLRMSEASGRHAVLALPLERPD